MNEYINYIEIKKSPEELEKEFIREFVKFRKEDLLVIQLKLKKLMRKQNKNV